MVYQNYRSILKQLKADLIGKDAHRGVTLTYSWLANQFGHFSLGFIPTVLLVRFFEHLYPQKNDTLTGIVLVSLFWLIFESLNLLIPILFGSSNTIDPESDSFQTDWKNLIFDTFTDLCFFWSGAFAAGLISDFSIYKLYTFGLLFMILAFCSYYWYGVKLSQNHAFYPFQFRLSQWNKHLTTENKQKIQNYIENADDGQHMLVFGSTRSGKSSLSVGISNELSIRGKCCFYTTASKLYGDFFYPERSLTYETSFWTWREAEYLVIDDINPGLPVSDIVNPSNFLHLIDTYSAKNVNNRRELRTKNIIWILGKDHKGLWNDMLIEIGVNEKDITSIYL
ncbi:MAG: ATP-binding protein [Bacteroidetes bacterium]|nr:MAG: ATP-binding protein [Bacteroidota bacterium]